METASLKLTRRFCRAKRCILALLIGWIGYSHAFAAGGHLDPDFLSGTGVFGFVNATALQPDGKIIVGGWFNGYNGTNRPSLVRLNADGSLDNAFNPNGGITEGTVKSIALLADGRIVICGFFYSYEGAPRNQIARLNPDGTLDGTFDVGAGVTNLVDQPVAINKVITQPDGRVIIVGDFSEVNGTSRNHIARLQTNGTLDVSFNPGTGPGKTAFNGIYISGAALQPDGKIIVTGQFDSFNGTAITNLARLNADGSLDSTFNPSAEPNSNIFSYIEAVTLQPDGKIIIAGGFITYAGTQRKGLARVNTNGSLDPTFNPGVGATSGQVGVLAVQSDGKIIIGGNFSFYNGVLRGGIARLNADGSLDTPFDPGDGVAGSASGGIFGTVFSISVQPDLKVIIGGNYTHFNGLSGTPQGSISRLLPATGAISFTSANYSVGEGVGSATITLVRTNGTDHRIVAKVTPSDITTSTADYIGTPGQLDLSFNPAGATSGIRANIPLTTLLQPDGKIILGGAYFNYGGTYRNGVVRLDVNGALDLTFDPGAGTEFAGAGNPLVKTSALQPDGKILIGGDFTYYNEENRNYIARVNPDGSLDPTFDPGAIASQSVWAIATQPDGKILIGGDHLNLANSIYHNTIARLNPNGSFDDSFSPPSLIGPGAVETIVVQPDGKIIIAGDFINYYNIDIGEYVPLRFIARLNSNGSLDTSFNPGTGGNSTVTCVALQPDGKIIIGGYFNQFNGAEHNYFVRLNSDGSVDDSFNTGTGPLGYPESVALQPDGKIILVGDFTAYNGVERETIARINTNGSVDLAFDPGFGPNAGLKTLNLQPDGRLLVGGGLVNFNGVTRRGIARIANGDFFVTWPAGDGLNKTVQLPIVNDLLPEANETLALNITLFSGGATLGDHPTSILTIIDNDSGSNVRPVANSQSINIDPDTPKAITLTAFDADGDLLSYIVTTNPIHGTLNGVPPNLIYTPDYGYVGSDSFAFKANDGQLNSTNPAIVSISGSTPFTQWQQQNFTPLQLSNPAISCDAADPDGDGIANLLEYAFHLDPNQPLVANLPKPDLDADFFSIIYTKTVGATDLTFALERSFDLATWNPVVPTNVILADNGVTQTVKAQVPLTGAVTSYLRLAVSR